MVCSNARLPPCRRSTCDHNVCGVAVKASSGSAASSSQPPRSSSASNCPGPHPEYPAKTRKASSAALGRQPCVALPDAPQADDRLGRYRTAKMHDRGLARGIGPPRQRVAGSDGARPVEDDAERALAVVIEQQDDGAREVRIVE
jgi:hypothetical protein